MTRDAPELAHVHGAADRRHPARRNPPAARNTRSPNVNGTAFAQKADSVYRTRLRNSNRRRHRWITFSASPSRACAGGAPPDGGIGSTCFPAVSSWSRSPPEHRFRPFESSHHVIQNQESGRRRPPDRSARHRPDPAGKCRHRPVGSLSQRPWRTGGRRAWSGRCIEAGAGDRPSGQIREARAARQGHGAQDPYRPAKRPQVIVRKRKRRCFDGLKAD